jgi:predicted CXXCH cytochrome family protein
MKMPGVVATASVLIAGLVCGSMCAEDPGEGKILRPVNGAALSIGEVDIIATAPSGKLQLDSRPISGDQPFPNVLHAVVKVSPGIHSIVLLWDGGKKEIRIFAGENPPSGYAPFHRHPPIADVQCTQCHEVNQRGRFRFKGGCFDCHQRSAFAGVHTHNENVLSQCGICHNAHGSTVKAHLLYPKETACRQCHD